MIFTNEQHYARAAAQIEDKSLPLRQKRKTRHTRMSMPYLWRRRRDLDSRAGKTRPTPLAGAPLRPLEYFSVTGRRLVTCRIIISIFFVFVNTFSKNKEFNTKKYKTSFGDNRRNRLKFVDFLPAGFSKKRQVHNRNKFRNIAFSVTATSGL